MLQGKEKIQALCNNKKTGEDSPNCQMHLAKRNSIFLTEMQEKSEDRFVTKTHQERISVDNDIVGFNKT